MGFKVSTSSINGVLPEECKYFKEDIFYEVLSLPCNKPNISEIVDLVVFSKIKDFYILDTFKAVSNEGTLISGLKLVVNLEISKKLTYIGKDSKKSIHSVSYDLLKSSFVIVPEMVNGKNARDLIKLDKVTIVPHTETIYKRQLSEKSLLSCILLLLNVNFF